jgi:hypothetical protein
MARPPSRLAPKQARRAGEVRHCWPHRASSGAVFPGQDVPMAEGRFGLLPRTRAEAGAGAGAGRMGSTRSPRYC